MSYPIGTVLTRRDPQGDALDDIKVVGGDNKSLSVQPANEFGGVLRKSAADIRAEYTTDNIDNSTTLNAPTYVDPGKTPEEIFNDASRASDEPVKPNAAAKVAAANAAAEAAEVVVEEPQVPQETVEEAAVGIADEQAEAETLKAEAALGDQHVTKTRRGRRPRAEQS